MNWYFKVLRNYAVFSGRARRKEYWYFFLFNLIIIMILTSIDHGTWLFSQTYRMGLLSSIYSLVVFIPSLAVLVRRLHDTGRSAWWLLLALIPIIGSIVLLIFAALDSDPGPNEYGLNPKIT
jgi:uncharacterized membrane protein YhaH (DUF805 family)